jgi:hypothetical protein
MGGIVPVAVVAKDDLLGALRDHAEGGRGDTVHRLRGRGCASEVQAFQRLDGPVFADGPRNALGQLVAAGLSPGLLAPRGRAVHQIHSILLIRSNIT